MRFDQRRRFLWPVAVLALSLSSMAWPHHSFAMFDRTKLTTIQGTVRKVEWTNPHVFVFVDVPDKSGKTYALECGSINMLARGGWKVNSVKAGDKVTVGLYPLRNGQPGGLLDTLTLPNGVKLK